MYQKCREHPGLAQVLRTGERQQVIVAEELPLFWAEEWAFCEHLEEQKKMAVKNDNHLLVEEGGFEPA